MLYDGHIYGFDLQQLQASPHRPSRGKFKCLEWTTGRVCWSTDRIGQASALVADGKLFLLTDAGCLILARADPSAYQELSRAQLFHDEICWTPPTLWHGKLFVRSPSQAVCVQVGRSEAASPATAVPVPAGRPWRFDPSWLLRYERDFPNDAPSMEEMTLWFGACLIVMAVAALATSSVTFLAQRGFGRLPAAVFWTVTFVLGVLGPNVFGSLSNRCVFTWPVSLYAAFHGALLMCWWAEHQIDQRRPRWLARLGLVGFVLVGIGYFELCKRVGMFIGWSFLFGFPFAFPLSYLAVRRRGTRRQISWSLVAFAAYFWSCQGLLLWKTVETP